MEIGSREVREVEFRERIRGYHQEDVDEFLERVARGIEVLEENLREAEQRLSSSSDTPRGDDLSAADDTIQRTLILAQRTADSLISEAQAEADRLVSEATSSAQKVMAEANQKANEAMEARVRLLSSEIDALGAKKRQLIGEVSSVVEKAKSTREAVVNSLSAAMDAVTGALQVDLSSIDSFEELEEVNVLADEEPGESQPSDLISLVEAGEVVEDEVIEPESLLADGEEIHGSISGEVVTPKTGKSDAAETDDSVPLSFGRPNFQLLSSEDPSGPVLFDEEES